MSGHSNLEYKSTTTEGAKFAVFIEFFLDTYPRVTASCLLITLLGNRIGLLIRVTYPPNQVLQDKQTMTSTHPLAALHDQYIYI